MRRIIDNYLQFYTYKTCARMWSYEWADSKNTEMIQRLHNRRGFVPSYMVDFIYQTPSHFRSAIDDSNMSVLQSPSTVSLMCPSPGSTIRSLFGRG